MLKKILFTRDTLLCLNAVKSLFSRWFTFTWSRPQSPWASLEGEQRHGEHQQREGRHGPGLGEGSAGREREAQNSDGQPRRRRHFPQWRHQSESCCFPHGDVLLRVHFCSCGKRGKYRRLPRRKMSSSRGSRTWKRMTKGRRWTGRQSSVGPATERKSTCPDPSTTGPTRFPSLEGEGSRSLSIVLLFPEIIRKSVEIHWGKSQWLSRIREKEKSCSNSAASPLSSVKVRTPSWPSLIFLRGSISTSST